MNEDHLKQTPRTQLELKLGEQINALITSSHALNVKTAAIFDPTLQPAAFHIVRWLYAYGPTSAAKLAEATAMDRSSVSRLVKQLEHLGYVMRESSPNDRRGIFLSLTDKGRQQTIDALKEKEFAYYERISRWNDEQLEHFIDLLKEFNGVDL
ncbi:MarR family winged helix-turn-helix transcriptional regulator [Paenibacillus luteus]|uniref:MarR family winged helix-turn-helix transcriptional regulator n=1 Tax=Paenibacillus luteus TaxID=2545753 RepID=UPI001143D6BD|nr:MarR family transcriptional regulator [Paenibacillus luteus]